MPKRPRPPLYWNTVLIFGPVLLIASTFLVINGHGVFAIAAVLLALILFFGPWLLSPYSTTARRIAHPTDADLDRSERLADSLGSVPVFGVIWRGAERLTGNAGRRGAEEYQRWRREHEDDSE